MLESERYELSQLRDDLRATAEEAERLARVLIEVGMLIPSPKLSPKQSALLEVLQKGKGHAKPGRS